MSFIHKISHKDNIIAIKIISQMCLWAIVCIICTYFVCIAVLYHFNILWTIVCVCRNVGSKKPFEQDCTRVQHPKTLLAQWLRDVHFVIKVIIWPF